MSQSEANRKSPPPFAQRRWQHQADHTIPYIHQNIVSQAPTESIETQCPRCRQHMQTWFALQDHLKFCLMCAHCSASFPTQRDLKSHISTQHGAAMPFSCHLCGKGYESQVGLSLHIKVHEGKSYPCPVCDSKMRQKSALRPHLRNVHGVAQCVTCLGVFKLGQEYTQHVLHCK